jgi:MoaA/NifB/PqqE/SkfB family radical SAM enzyme
MYFNRLFLLVTEACDSRCALCDYWLIKKPVFIDPMAVETRVVPFLQEQRVGVVCISGGEPTLHAELPRIVAAVRRVGTTATLITSTTKLEDHFFDLRTLVTHYMVSLDGNDRDSYRRSRGVDAFEHVVAWISRLKSETTADIAVSCVLQAGNIDRVRPLYDLCVELGVDKLFLRVPDIKPGSFARKQVIRLKTLKQLTITSDQVESLRQDLKLLRDLDRERGILGQSTAMLDRKVRFFESMVQGLPYAEEDSRCDVPLTSLVLSPDFTCHPCFYLPYAQQFDEQPAQGAAFEEVYRRMLNDVAFRRQHCNACQQFDGHKHAISYG